MQGNRSRDTGPEMALRRELHRRGLRYRVGVAPLPGVRRTVDIAFPRAKLAVMVDGCFWHGCPEHHRPPKSHSEYWVAKIDRNKERDLETTQLLEDAGWDVLRLWEHEPFNVMADAVQQVLTERQDPAVPGRETKTRPGQPAEPDPPGQLREPDQPR
jgi:DNA mismatch endonuclease (patch repair protein)